MNKFLTGVALAALTTAAAAADLPSRKAAPMYEPPLPVISWAGPYLGAQVGGVFGSGSTNVSSWGAGNGGCQAGRPLISSATSDPVVTTTPIEKVIKTFVKKPPKDETPPKDNPTSTTVVGDPIVVDSSLAALGNPCPTGVSTSSVTTTTTTIDKTGTTASAITETTTTSVAGYPLATGAGAAAATNGNVGGSGGAFIGGLVGGYRFQNGNFVYGLEATFSGLAGGGANGTVSGVSNDGFFNYLGTTRVSRKLNWLGTVNGQVGYAVMPQLLVFAEGGLAYGGVSSRTSIVGSATSIGGDWVGGNWFGDQGINKTLVGWNAGAGVEYLFNPNWSARLSYRYYDLGSANYNVAWGGAGMTGQTQIHNRFNGNIVQAGVFWHWH